MDLKVRKHIYFYGRVQGVGFRYYAVQKAGQLGTCRVGEKPV